MQAPASFSAILSCVCITLSCIADGTALGFMAGEDIYALMGPVLDEAIAASAAAEDAERRSISVVCRRAMGTASVHVELWGKTDFSDEAIPLIARRYHGTLSCAEGEGKSRPDLLFEEPEESGKQASCYEKGGPFRILPESLYVCLSYIGIVGAMKVRARYFWSRL